MQGVPPLPVKLRKVFKADTLGVDLCPKRHRCGEKCSEALACLKRSLGRGKKDLELAVRRLAEGVKYATLCIDVAEDDGVL